jgi:DNA-binding transcriptional LysR family regulator
MQTLVDDLTNKAGGTIAIGASYTFGEYILPHIIAKMKEQYPLIHPSIRIQNTKEIIDLVKKHQLDIGIIEGFYEKATLNSKVVSKDKMVIVASPIHPLLSVKREIRISDLEEETWILREEGSGTREAAENLFRRYDFTPKNVMEFGSTQVIKESVEAGLGISLLSSWAIKKELTNGYIGIIQVNGLPFKRNFSILTPATYQTKALQTFIEILLTYLSDPRKNRF